MTQIARELWSLVLIRIYVALLIGFLLVIGGTQYVRPHSFYDASCCSDRDCNVVPDGTVVNVKDGVEVKGFGILNYSDPRLRWSRDMSDHLCISKSFTEQKLNCVYRRPMMD